MRPRQAPRMKYPTITTATAGQEVLIDLGSFAAYHPQGNVWKVSVDWGDGLSTIKYVPLNGGLGSMPHTYAEAGKYDVTVSVEDGGFQVGQHDFIVGVQAAQA